MSASLKIFAAPEEPEDKLSGVEIVVAGVPTSDRPGGTAALYRHTTLVLWSCGILTIFVLPVFAASLGSDRFRIGPESMAVLRSVDGPVKNQDQGRLQTTAAVWNSITRTLAAASSGGIPDSRSVGATGENVAEFQSLRLLLPLSALNEESRDFNTRVKPLAQILARRIRASGLSVSLTVSGVDCLDRALLFAGELSDSAAIVSDRVAVSVQSDVPVDFLTVVLCSPLPAKESPGDQLWP